MKTKNPIGKTQIDFYSFLSQQQKKMLKIRHSFAISDIKRITRYNQPQTHTLSNHYYQTQQPTSNYLDLTKKTSSEIIETNRQYRFDDFNQISQAGCAQENGPKQSHYKSFVKSRRQQTKDHESIMEDLKASLDKQKLLVQQMRERIQQMSVQIERLQIQLEQKQAGYEQLKLRLGNKQVQQIQDKLQISNLENTLQCANEDNSKLKRNVEDCIQKINSLTKHLQKTLRENQQLYRQIGQSKPIVLQIKARYSSQRQTPLNTNLTQMLSSLNEQLLAFETQREQKLKKEKQRQQYQLITMTKSHMSELSKVSRRKDMLQSRVTQLQDKLKEAQRQPFQLSSSTIMKEKEQISIQCDLQDINKLVRHPKHQNQL